MNTRPSEDSTAGKTSIRDELAVQIVAGLAVAGILAVLGLALRLRRRRIRTLVRPVSSQLDRWTTRRVVDSEDPLVEHAYRCWLDAGIPAHELDDPDHLREWLHEDQCEGPAGETLHGESLHRYLVVSHKASAEGVITVGAALWATHFPDRRMLFLSALAIAPCFRLARPSPLAALMEFVRSDLFDGALRACGSVVFECEDVSEVASRLYPADSERLRAIRETIEQQRRFARLFEKHGFAAYRLNIAYEQPPLRSSLAEPGAKLNLCVARRSPGGARPVAITTDCEDAEAVVDFVYNGVYASGFSDRTRLAEADEAVQYRALLREMKDRAVAKWYPGERVIRDLVCPAIQLVPLPQQAPVPR